MPQTKEQKNAASAKYREEHREEIRLQRAKYNAAHKAEQAAYAAEYNTKHRERDRAKKNANSARSYRKHRKERLAKNAQRYIENRDDILAYHAERYQNNKEAICQKTAEWRHANPEKKKAINAAWNAEHPEQLREYVRGRRARKAHAPINDLSAAQEEELKKAQGYRCAYCKKYCPEDLTLDHITPLNNQGPHTLHNVVMACQSCNSKKHTGPPLSPVQPLLLTIAPAKKKAS